MLDGIHRSPVQRDVPTPLGTHPTHGVVALLPISSGAIPRCCALPSRWGGSHVSVSPPCHRCPTARSMQELHLPPHAFPTRCSLQHPPPPPLPVLFSSLHISYFRRNAGRVGAAVLEPILLCEVALPVRPQH